MATKPFHYKTKTEPYDHQIDAFHKLYGKEHMALFMEQGTGKTKTTIDIACNLYLEKKITAALIIAPNGVHEQWITYELPKHCSVLYDSWKWKSSGSRPFMDKQEDFIAEPNNERLKWLAVNVETFSSTRHMRTFIEYLLNNKVFVIVDECTRIKNPGANRTINIVYNLARKKMSGKKVVAVEPYSAYRIILTGMMITNSPYDLWSMFEFLKHDYFGVNYYAFKARYGIEVTDAHPTTGKTYRRKIREDEIKSVHEYHAAGKSPETISAILGMSESSVEYLIAHPNLLSPYKRLDELKRMIEPVSFIVRKEDCLDLPPKVYSKLYVEMNSHQKRIYRELKNRFLAEYEDHTLTVQNKVSLIGRLQQVTGGFFPYEEDDEHKKLIPITDKNPKIEALIGDLEESGDECIIVWARFVGELKLIYKVLSEKFKEKHIELYYGGVNQEKRNRIRKAFTEGEVDILVANARTAGIGLNLQNAHTQYFFSNSYSLEDREQAEDRSHRIGQEHSVLYKDIIMSDTVDENVYAVLANKKSLLNYFRDKSLAEFLQAEGDLN